MSIQLQKVALPDFGMPTSEPVLTADIYKNRLAQLRLRMTQQNFDYIIIYADREHTANLTYICGYDPRFEESFLIVDKTNVPALLVGNEGWGYCELAPLPVRRILYQPLSLMGQDRSKSASLRSILKEEGINNGSKIGIVGWKYFNNKEFTNAEHQFEVPYYLIDTLHKMGVPKKHISNACAIFMNPSDGLRTNNEAAQLALFECAACFTSNGLKQVLFNMKPGMTEYEAVSLMKINGFPHGAHTMLTNGHRATYGLPSPSFNTLKVGERFTMCLCLWGALNARAGWLVYSAEDLPDGVKDYLDKLAIPYFRAITKWYEHIGIGVKGKELYDIIHGEIGAPFFGVGLNPGHLIHIDEWLHSPIYKNSDETIKSGMAFQVDVIPATGTDYHTINIEDGIAIADEDLRHEIAIQFPETWQRIQARRQFMKEVIGINLKPEVLPFSNIPAYLPPYMLSPDMVLTKSN